MKFLIWLVGHAVALGAAVWLLPGIGLTDQHTGRRLLTLVIVGGIFGAISAVVKPVVKFLAFPFIILTLGLFLLVINALLLLLTGTVAGWFGLGFRVDGFLTAVLGGIVIALASMIIEALLPDRDR
ncbi:MAG: phage holin family protein [Actinomycetota bacterium]|nr:phage holin family protein [Actinomycetota bacterium]